MKSDDSPALKEIQENCMALLKKKKKKKPHRLMNNLKALEEAFHQMVWQTFLKRQQTHLSPMSTHLVRR